LLPIFIMILKPRFLFRKESSPFLTNGWNDGMGKNYSEKIRTHDR
jgi:hypothetical protein